MRKFLSVSTIVLVFVFIGLVGVAAYLFQQNKVQKKNIVNLSQNLVYLENENLLRNEAQKQETDDYGKKLQAIKNDFASYAYAHPLPAGVVALPSFGLELKPFQKGISCYLVLEDREIVCQQMPCGNSSDLYHESKFNPCEFSEEAVFPSHQLSGVKIHGQVIDKEKLQQYFDSVSPRLESFMTPKKRMVFVQNENTQLPTYTFASDRLITQQNFTTDGAYGVYTVEIAFYHQPTLEEIEKLHQLVAKIVDASSFVDVDYYSGNPWMQ